MNVLRFTDVAATAFPAGKRVFIRAGLNVPLGEQGAIADDTRIRASLPAMRLALAAEIEAPGQALAAPARPLAAVVGGSKVSTKLAILRSLADKVEQLIVGGGIANTFLLAAGRPTGRSLAEPALVGEARDVMQAMSARGGEVPLPLDVVTARELSPAARCPAIEVLRQRAAP